MIKKNKILAILQLPPPIHGQSIVNKTIFESKAVNDSLVLIISLTFCG